MAAAMESMFHICVRHIFDSWTALRVTSQEKGELAVEGGFGGVSSTEKAAWMIDATEQWFKENSNLELDEVEDFLADIMNTEFDTVVDDGTLQQVSQNVCLSWSLVIKGQGEEAVRRMQALPKADVAKCVQEAQMKDDDSSDDSDGEDDVPQLTPSTSQNSNPATPSVSNEQNAQREEETPMEEDDGWTTVPKKSTKKR